MEQLKLLTPEQVQEELDWSKGQVYRLFQEKLFPKVKIGRKMYVDKDTMYKYFKGQNYKMED